MKKALLVAALAVWGLNGYTQCVPNQLYADSVFGAWPDTTTNFNGGVVGVFYSDTLNLLVPTNAGLIDPNFSAFSIDSVAMTEVQGLPPGLAISCNSQTGAPCTYLTGQVGCGLIEGTPTQAGTFPMTIKVNAYVTVPFLGTQAIPYEFPGYSITIAENTVGLESLAPAKLASVKNVPNPFAERTLIEFSLSKAAPVKVKVFNLVGEELWRRGVQGKAGVNRVNFEGVNLENGIYIYHVESAGTKFTGRMMVNR